MCKRRLAFLMIPRRDGCMIREWMRKTFRTADIVTEEVEWEAGWEVLTRPSCFKCSAEVWVEAGEVAVREGGIHTLAEG